MYLRPQDDVSYDCLLERLVIKDIEAVLFSSRIRWLSHVDHCSVWIARVREHKIVMQKAPGRPKLTCDELVRCNQISLAMEGTDPEDHQGRLHPLERINSGLPK